MKIKCDKCSGHGFMPDNSKCPKCHGKGKVFK